MKIKEIIVVEGKNDTAAIKRAVDADTVETHGLGLTVQTLTYLKQVAQKRGIIIFTDPDIPGEKIRTWISQEIPTCKHAFINKKDARTTKKVGIEHASNEAIQEALKHLVDYQTKPMRELTLADIVGLGLVGSQSQQRRQQVCDFYHVGHCNNKTLLKRLNALGITKEQLVVDIKEHIL